MRGKGCVETGGRDDERETWGWRMREKGCVETGGGDGERETWGWRMRGRGAWRRVVETARGRHGDGG